MPYLFYGRNTRSDFLCYFLDMATPIKSVIDDSTPTRFVSYTNMAAMSIIVLGHQYGFRDVM